MHKKKHILITTSRLDVPGGIERAVVATANLFAANGHRVSILVLDEQTTCFYPVSEAVVLYHAALHFGVGIKGNALSRKYKLVQNLISLRSLIKNISPDVIIASDYVHAVCLRLVVFKNIKLFSWEHHHFAQLKKNTFWTFLSNWLYPRLNGVICLNKDEVAYYTAKGCAATVIPNFVAQEKQIAPLRNKRLLTIGWLSHTKGADLISKIAALVYEKHPEWTWKIIGSGAALNDRLTNMEVVQPYSADIIEEYLSSSVYVLPSRFECFPMVLLEAMSVGLPCVAFNCPTGPRHIITHKHDGLLVENGNVEKLAAAISELISQHEERKRLGAAARDSVKRFNPDAVYLLWEKLLQAE